MINYVATLTDITVSKSAADEILQLAFYDPLTQLPNRRLFIDRLEKSLIASTRSGKIGAIMFLDLDNFKNLNDSLGHFMGDLLLQQVADRLKMSVREEDTVARFGGDEFVVMLEDLSNQLHIAAALAKTIAEKILAKLSQPYLLGTHKYSTSSSIGLVLFWNQNESAEELLKYSDIAMYEAKKAGRNTLCFFDPQMQANIKAYLTLENELRTALEKKQFQLHYQIQVDNKHQLLGAEVLIRWLHPERGLVYPSDFMQMVEDTNLIIPIGHWVLETACKQLKAWAQDKFTKQLTLSVNVSAKQYRQANFVSLVESTIQHHGINPKRLKLELTESTLVENIEKLVTSMNELGKIGVQLSLDDFGTGYSSLQYLKRLPLYQLKIDQSFVRDIEIDNNDKEIVRTIISMANAMNLNVIAEGVETKEQLALLEGYGCLTYQGYLFGKPIPIEQLDAQLKELSRQ